MARILRYKNIFAKGYVPSWFEEVLVIKNAKSTVPWTYVFSDLNGEEILERFAKKDCRKQIKKSLELNK